MAGVASAEFTSAWEGTLPAWLVFAQEGFLSCKVFVFVAAEASARKIAVITSVSPVSRKRCIVIQTLSNRTSESVVGQFRLQGNPHQACGDSTPNSKHRASNNRCEFYILPTKSAMHSGFRHAHGAQALVATIDDV
ncbi:MAG TPA: hypothetical protein DDW52_14575 [Planctomycetaceae bacterium]|nr:hypothetical protein [Planctomycetaceae bacterium]